MLRIVAFLEGSHRESSRRSHVMILELCTIIAFTLELAAGCLHHGSSVHDLPDATYDYDAGNGPRWPECNPESSFQEVTFIHVSDLHAAYTPDNPEGSPAGRLHGYYQTIRRSNPYTLFTHAGDAYEKGSVAEILSGGLSTRQVVEAMGFDLSVMGNHDFAMSLEETLLYSHSAASTVISSNVAFQGPDPHLFGAVDQAELLVGCIRIGFFGMVTRPYDELNNQLDRSYYPELPARYDFIDLARQHVSELRDRMDLVVMLSHLGLSLDLEIAEEVEGIDVILGGHSHRQTSSPTISSLGTITVQAGAYACCAARLILFFDLPERRLKGHRFELVHNTPSLMPESEHVRTVVDAVMETHAPDALHDRAFVSTFRPEAEIALIAAAAAVHSLSVDTALFSEDDVWTQWSPGSLNQQDLADTVPVERQPPGTSGLQSLYRVTVTGQALDHILDSLSSSSWARAGLMEPDPFAIYVVALPKYIALNLPLFFGDGVADAQVSYAMEAWEALDLFAVHRTASCLYLDSDEHLPDCDLLPAP